MEKKVLISDSRVKRNYASAIIKLKCISVDINYRAVEKIKAYGSVQSLYSTIDYGPIVYMFRFSRNTLSDKGWDCPYFKIQKFLFKNTFNCKPYLGDGVFTRGLRLKSGIFGEHRVSLASIYLKENDIFSIYKDIHPPVFINISTKERAKVSGFL